MRRVTPHESWPDSWKESYQYDLLEVYGETSHRGYAYAYAQRRKHTLELIRKVARPGARILDVAAAQGNYSLTLAEMGYDITWNDLRQELADYVKLKYEQGRVHYVAGNVFALSLNNRFDVVLAAEIIEHVAHPDDFLRMIAPLVKPGGHVVMTTPNGEYIRNRLPKFSECADPAQFENVQFKPNADGHIFLLHRDEIDALAQQAGLSVLEVRLFANPITSGHMKSEALLRWAPRRWIEALEQVTRSLPMTWQRRLHTGMAILFQRLDPNGHRGTENTE
ncbi:MAG: methyltransferase domain-containing protein, partial [Acidobacteria bacterium]|nr:methyltransferase domain-containing protein [Acidobacteriota bacterium]